MNKSRFLIAGAVLCTVFSLNAEAKLYKWVDSNGTTHYGETIPPEYAGRNAQQLENGRLTERKETFDNIKKSAHDETPAEKAAIETQRQDQALLNSYSNEKEIDLARDRNLSQFDARQTSYNMMLKSAQATLDSLHQESNNRQIKGLKIPLSLTEDIAASEARVADIQKELDINQKERDATKARFDGYKKRYRELKGLPAEGTDAK